MVFVPVIVAQAEPSARARDLARRLEETVATFERQYPGTSPADIRQAVQLATARPGTNPRAAKLVMALLAGLLALGIGLFAALNRQSGGLGGEGDPGLPWVMIGVFAAVLGALVAIRRRG
jgi:hypothetical protein